MDAFARKKRHLVSHLNALDSALLAFSGGVDSSLLLVVAHGVLGQRLEAVSFRSVLFPQWELDEAAQLAKDLGVRHRLIDVQPLSDPFFTRNGPDRCYYCKRRLMSRLRDMAGSLGTECVMEGSHAGDRPSERPGMRALRELHIRSPLLEAGLDKEEIRAWAREVGLPHWSRPPRACLATRIPVDEPILHTTIEMVRRAEDHLRSLGFAQYRARWFENVVGIQVDAQEVARLTADPIKQVVVKQMHAVGFQQVWVDLQGYGSQPPRWHSLT